MTQPEDDFDKLRTLVRCKRYEQPPPGYFLSFSDKLIARIEAEQAAEYSSWWSWIVERFDARPALVCAYGMAVSCLLFMGVGFSQAFEVESAAAPNALWLAATPASPFLAQEFGHAPHFDTTASTAFASNPLFGEDAGVLLLPSRLDLRPASFSPTRH